MYWMLSGSVLVGACGSLPKLPHWYIQRRELFGMHWVRSWLCCKQRDGYSVSRVCCWHVCGISQFNRLLFVLFWILFCGLLQRLHAVSCGSILPKSDCGMRQLSSGCVQQCLSHCLYRLRSRRIFVQSDNTLPELRRGYV